MRRFLIFCALVFLLGFTGAAAGCKATPAQKQSAQEVENSHKLIAAGLLDYVNKDASLSDKDKARWKALIDTDLENIQKLRKALED